MSRSDAAAASGAAAPVRLRLALAYRGDGFHGFAENEGVPTVAGELRRALRVVLGEDVALTCAGRTDAGVHATGQVVTVDVPAGRDPSQLRDSLNALLAPGVAVRSVEVVAADFDARFSATWRRYVYSVWNQPFPDPFARATSWWVRDELDLAAMSAACPVLVGEHDFSSFCRRPRGVEVSLVRRVIDAGWAPADPPGMLAFTVTATAFCHQMVRAVTGALVAVGRGRLDADGMARLLAARDRSGAPNLAPPHGLCLVGVGYDGDDAGLAG